MNQNKVNYDEDLRSRANRAVSGKEEMRQSYQDRFYNKVKDVFYK